MKETLQIRLQNLRGEFESGTKMAAELEGKLSSVRTTLLRISGAIQVLEELMNEEDSREREEVHPPLNGTATPSANVG